MNYWEWLHAEQVREAEVRLVWALQMKRENLEAMIRGERTLLRDLTHNRNPGDEGVLRLEEQFNARCVELTNYHQQKMNELRVEHAEFIEKLNAELAANLKL